MWKNPNLKKKLFFSILETFFCKNECVPKLQSSFYFFEVVLRNQTLCQRQLLLNLSLISQITNGLLPEHSEYLWGPNTHSLWELRLVGAITIRIFLYIQLHFLRGGVICNVRNKNKVGKNNLHNGGVLYYFVWFILKGEKEITIFKSSRKIFC